MRDCRAEGINERADVIGFCSVASGYKLYLWGRDGHVIGLTPFPGASESGGGTSVINDEGDVVENTISGAFGSVERAFFWHDGVASEIGSTGAMDTEAHMLNERGQVVGSSRFGPTSGSSARAFLWQDGVMTDLGTLGGKESTALAINDRGQVAGTSETADGHMHAFYWEKGVMTDLGTLGGNVSGSVAIGEDGLVTGYSATAKGEIRMFQWRAGVMSDPLGEPFSTGPAKFVNDHGEMAGWHPWRQLPVIWKDGSLTPLGLSAQPVALNDRSQVLLDEGQLTCPQRHAYLWDKGTIWDLGGPCRTCAVALNEHDQIVGEIGARVALWTPR